jgi:thiol:disulfide interchange protein
VVAIWGTLLAVLAVVGAGFGNSALVLEISGSAAGLVLLLAAAVWLDRRLRPRTGWLRQPVRAGGVLMLAVTVMLAWLGLAFGAWLVMVAVVPLTAAIGLEIAARRDARARAAAARTVRQRGPARGLPASRALS